MRSWPNSWTARWGACPDSPFAGDRIRTGVVEGMYRFADAPETRVQTLEAISERVS